MVPIDCSLKAGCWGVWTVRTWPFEPGAGGEAPETRAAGADTGCGSFLRPSFSSDFFGFGKADLALFFAPGLGTLFRAFDLTIVLGHTTNGVNENGREIWLE